MAAITSAIIGGIGAATSAAGSIASAVGRASRKDPTFDIGQETSFEKQGSINAIEGLAGFRNALGREVAQGSSAQLDLANMLQQYAETGAIPTAQDNVRSQAFAQSQFDPQRVAMRQAFQEQLTQANRQAALSGRGINDPILRAKLASEQTRQNALLQSQQGAFATQFAMQQPLQRLSFMSDRANTLVNRGQTALGNFANMAQLGLGAQQQGFGQRFSLAQAKYMEQANTRSEGEKIGDVLGSIGKATAGLGSMTGMGAGISGGGGLQSLIGGMGGGGAAAAGAPGGGVSFPQLQPTAFMTGSPGYASGTQQMNDVRQLQAYQQGLMNFTTPGNSFLMK